MSQSIMSIVPLHFHIDELSMDEYNSVVVPVFERIITTRVRSVPIKKEIISNLYKYEGAMFSELCSDALLLDNRTYMRYKTIAIKGFKQPTLYVFNNDAYESVTNKMDSTIYIEIRPLTVVKKDETPLVNHNEFNKDLIKLMRYVVWGYIILYIYIGMQYIAAIK